MMSVVFSLLMSVRGWARSRAALQLEVLALRHQVQILERSRRRRLRLSPADRVLWVWLSRVGTEWRAALVIVKPETVIAWHRQGFRLFWTWKSRQRGGRPAVPAAVRALIRTMSQNNALWGAPRIHVWIGCFRRYLQRSTQQSGARRSVIPSHCLRMLFTQRFAEEGAQFWAQRSDAPGFFSWFRRYLLEQPPPTNLLVFHPTRGKPRNREFVNEMAPQAGFEPATLR